MNNADFLIEKPSTGSNTCILIGRLPGEMPPQIDCCRTVLWLVDAASANCPPGRSPAENVSVLPVDHCAAELLEKSINEFLLQSPKHLPSLYVTRWIPPEHESKFGVAIDLVFACVESRQRDRVTREQDACAWQSYLFENCHAYATRRLPESWHGALTGMPAFVCGAGLSFDVSAPKLVEAAHRGVILAADSSLRALAKLGVQADFAVSVDVAKTPSKCLPETLAPARVILSATSPPQWSDAIPASQRFYVSSNQLTLDWLAAQGVSRTKVAVSENCGATAIELARFLGCSPIYLFGMDLALNAEGPIRRHHESVDAAIYANSGFDARQRFPRVPGNFTPEVFTHVIGDWRALDRRIAEWPKGLVSVVTDRGAKLRNTTVLRPEQFVLPAGELDKEQRLSALTEPPPPTAESIRVVADKLNKFGDYLVHWAPSLRLALETGGPNTLVDKLRPFFAFPENGQMLGAYSLKLMPHLLPPIEMDAELWRVMIGELENLGQHAKRGAATMRS
jgi:Protein of unknown function DUF115